MSKKKKKKISFDSLEWKEELLEYYEQNGIKRRREGNGYFLVAKRELLGVPTRMRVGYVTGNSLEHQIECTEKRFVKVIESATKLFHELKDKYPQLEEKTFTSTYSSILNQGHVTRDLDERVTYNVENYLLREEISLFENARDYPEIFPRARARGRKIIAYLGDTNSGKTYHAMSKIAESFSSAYLAPLRLLALEAYEYLNNNNVPTSLITGEEKIVDEESWCTSSTVECFNPDNVYDVVVIDEIQMIDDKDRGAFFTQALVGANAKEVVVTAPAEYRERLEEIAEYLGEEIEVHVFERKSELKLIQHPIELSAVKPNTAIVTFSRRNVFAIRDMLPPHVRSSVIYGALGYDVRRKQAKDFIDGKTDVLITTDAIGMGLNLPIETVLFTSHVKFNGECTTELSHMLTKQIAGRAGRFGKYDVGYVGATGYDTLEHVAAYYDTPLHVELQPLNVLPTNAYIETMMEKYQLSIILKNWERIDYGNESIFNTKHLKQQINAADLLEDMYPTNVVKEYYRLIYCPIDFEKDYSLYRQLVVDVVENNMVSRPVYDENARYGIETMESMIRKLTIISWFSQQFPELCLGGYESFTTYLLSLNEKISMELHKRLSQKRKVKPKAKYKRDNNVRRTR